MRRRRGSTGFVIASAFLCGLGAPAWAQSPAEPDWAYPMLPPAVQPDATVLLQVPGSDRRFTQAQIDGGYGTADWYPNEHPPMPPIVANGAAPPVRACGMCHLPNGAGHPESASLNGLPAGYIAAQMAAFKNGSRKSSRAGSMVPIAKGASDADIATASAYFASLPPVQWIRVVEADTVPKTVLGQGAIRYVASEAGTEPLAGRIIEVPEDAVRAERRDAHSGFIAYVPSGSLALGAALVTTGGERTTACASCHGAKLTGLDPVPGIAGRSPVATFRQLNDFKRGARSGEAAEPMQMVIADLSREDMVAIAAYLASAAP